MGKRLTVAERARRDGAFRAWVEHDRDFSATSSALGIDEPELRRWARYHQWVHRWAKETRADSIALQQLADFVALERLIAEVERLARLAGAIDADGKPLYVPRLVRFDLAGEAITKTLDAGGTAAERVHVLIQQKLGASGLVSDDELRRLPFPALLDRLRERLRDQGVDSGPQA